MASAPLVPTDRWSLETVLFDREAIRGVNQQRFEMEQLEAITHLDAEAMEIVGYKQVAGDEFWTRGHVPGRPLFPGVLMLEALAQLTSFYIGHTMPDIGFIGFGGLESAKFRATVVPGQQLVLVGLGREIRRRRAIFDTQGWVDGVLAVEATIVGMRV